MPYSNIRHEMQKEIEHSVNDGPYIFMDEDRLESYNILWNTDARRYQIQKQTVSSLPESKASFVCYIDNSPESAVPGSFEFEVDATSAYNESFSVYKEPEQLLAISDIEGNFSGLKNILIANGVIDDHYNWTFKTGHLVITGDLIDRGTNVLACLWLIYKLDNQSRAEGGKVHYLLGNHEVMNFYGDFRYVHPKYIAYLHSLNWNPFNLLSPYSVIGKWLRQKNSVEKIGKYLFLHAGFSKEILERKLSLDQINSLIKDNLDKPIEKIEGDAHKLLLDELGPLWYRGLVDRNKKYQAATVEQVQDTLGYYKVSKIVVGHTLVPFIQQFHNKKVIAIDTNMPGKKNQSRVQSLLINKGKEFVVDEKGNKWRL